MRRHGLARAAAVVALHRRHNASATQHAKPPSPEAVAAILRRSVLHAADRAQHGNGFAPSVTLAAFAAALEELKPGSVLAGDTRSALELAAASKRAVRFAPHDDAVHLESNSNAKHARAFLRVLARVPDAGVRLDTLRTWLNFMQSSEIDAALAEGGSFSAWCRRKQGGDVVVPALPDCPDGDDVRRAVFRALLAAPDAGITLAAMRSAVATATGAPAPEPDAIKANFIPALWCASIPVDAYIFCDWTAIMQRVQLRLPVEGVALANFVRYVQTEQQWPAHVNIADTVTRPWIEAHFAHLFVVRTSRTDGSTTLIVPVGPTDAVSGSGAAMLHALVAGGSPDLQPALPVDHGWRNAHAAVAALTEIAPSPCGDWMRVAMEHPYLDSQVVVSLRPRTGRQRVAIFVAAAASGLSAADADRAIARSAVLAAPSAVEASRVALRLPSQAAHGPNDVVSPPWLETEFVLAAQLAGLADAVAQGRGLPVDHVVVVCAVHQQDAMRSVLRDAGAGNFTKLSVVTPDGVSEA